MVLEFICGCRTGNVIDRVNLETMKLVEFDTDGMLVCGIHKQRRKGWRSIPIHSLAAVKRFKSSYFGRSPQEIEAHIVFREPWSDVPLVLDVNHEPDLRDNRDPQVLGREIMARKNGHNK